MVRTAKLHRSPSGGEIRGKRAPSMLVLDQLGPLRKEMIPTLFRIAGGGERSSGVDQRERHRCGRLGGTAALAGYT